MTSNGTLPLRTVVTIDGLQTTQGKELNGSSACIFGPPKKGRYPCAIYASGRGVPMEKPEKKSIKRENIAVKENQRCPLLHSVGIEYVKLGCKNEHDALFAPFWLEAIYDQFPEDYAAALDLATYFMLSCKEYKKAYDMIVQTIKVIPRSSELYWNLSRSNLVMTCIYAKRDPEEVLKWALEIDMEFPHSNGTVMARNALEVLLGYSRKYRNAYDKLSGGSELNVYHRTAKTLCSRYPDDMDYFCSMANAESLLGNYYKAAKIYRKVINSGQLDPDELKDLKEDLCLAQLRCPGAPMADYRIISVNLDEKEVLGIHKSKQGSYDLIVQREGSKLLTDVCPKAGTTMKDLNIRHFPLPTDPDDMSVFAGAKIPK